MDRIELFSFDVGGIPGRILGMARPRREEMG